MAFMLIHFELDNYDEFKELFDSDPAGRKAVAKGHRILRGVDDPNQVFLSVEYSSADEAKSVLDRLKQSGALDRFPPKVGPTITDVAEETSY
jgi:hypothetical protein